MTALSHCITCGEWVDSPCIYGGCPFRAEGRSMTARLRTIAACNASVQAEMQHFPPVPRPADVTDAEAFPNIAAAIEHARWLREQAQ